jgi:AhpC/TSA family
MSSRRRSDRQADASFGRQRWEDGRANAYNRIDEASRMTDISPHRDTPLPAGTVAPDFELPSTPDQKVMLSEFRGQPVILVFYPRIGARSAPIS